MAKVLIAVATQPKIVPVGPPQGKFRIGILNVDNAVVQSQDVDIPAAEFSGIPSGQYTAVAVRLDVNGIQLAGTDPLTQAFEVPPETMTVDAPMSLTISVNIGVG